MPSPLDWKAHLAAQAAHVVAEEWIAEEAKRCGVARKSILLAISRGWTVEEIEALPCIASHKLAGGPPDGLGD